MYASHTAKGVDKTPAGAKGGMTKPKKPGCQKGRQLQPIFFFFLFSFLFMAEPVAYRSPQARSQVGAAAASLYHSNARSEPCLCPTPQLVTTLDA